MTRVQQALWKFETDYYGHPYYVTGHALYNAIAPRVDPTTRHELQVSMGGFVPGAIGSYPGTHSQTGGSPYVGTRLHPVESYADLWLFRDPAHSWLSDSRPRDAINTHDLHSHGGRQAFAPATRFGLSQERRSSKRTVTWHLHATLHASAHGSLLPLVDETLDGLQVGGGRNYGFGRLALVDSQCVDLDELSYARLEESEAFAIELVSPYVIETAVSNADDQTVPWWWDVDESDLRCREERLVTDDVHTLNTIDHGQVVGYTGSEPIETAKNGVLGVGTHAKFGYGEFRVRPLDDVPGITGDVPASDGGVQA